MHDFLDVPDLRPWRAPIAIAVLLLLSACCGGDRPRQTPTAPSVVETSASTPEPTATAAALPSAVRQVIDAMAAGDFMTLTAMVKYTPTPCISQEGAFGEAPLCESERRHLPPGTAVDVLPASFCEGGYLFPENVPVFLQIQAEQGRLAYYGTLKSGTSILTPPLRGEYSVLFSLVSDPGMKFVVVLEDGKIIALGARGYCGGTVPPASDAAWLQPPR